MEQFYAEELFPLGLTHPGVKATFICSDSLHLMPLCIRSCQPPNCQTLGRLRLKSKLCSLIPWNHCPSHALTAWVEMIRVHLPNPDLRFQWFVIRSYKVIIPRTPLKSPTEVRMADYFPILCMQKNHLEEHLVLGAIANATSWQNKPTTNWSLDFKSSF